MAASRARAPRSQLPSLSPRTSLDAADLSSLTAWAPPCAVLRARSRSQGDPDHTRRDAHARATRRQLARAHRRASLRSHHHTSRQLSHCESSRGRVLRSPLTPAGTQDGGARRLGGHRDLPHLLRVHRGAWPADLTLLAPSSRLRSSHLIITLTLLSAHCCPPTAYCDPRADAARFRTPTAGSAPPPSSPASRLPPMTGDYGR